MLNLGCRSCGSRLQHTFADLGMSPLANSYVEASRLNEMEPFYPLHAYLCETCFLVQLVPVTKAEDIFCEYAYFSSYSDSWVEHARIYADAVTKRFSLTGQSQVVEIASNDGYLLQFFAAKGIPVLGIEPAKNVAEEAVRRGIPTLVRFFGEEAARDLIAGGKRADLIIGNKSAITIISTADARISSISGSSKRTNKSNRRQVSFSSESEIVGSTVSSEFDCSATAIISTTLGGKWPLLPSGSASEAPA